MLGWYHLCSYLISDGDQGLGLENLCFATGARPTGVERLSSAFQRERTAQLGLLAWRALSWADEAGKLVFLLLSDMSK